MSFCFFFYCEFFEGFLFSGGVVNGNGDVVGFFCNGGYVGVDFEVYNFSVFW